MKGKPGICYLCGRSFRSVPTKDHVPPKQVYPKHMRGGLNLFWLPAHKQCNGAYKKDKEYLVHSLAPMAGDSPAAKQLWAANFKYYRTSPHGKRLYYMIVGEFDDVILPDGIASKRVDGERVNRVIWKICRGLFFKEQQRFLPQDTLQWIRAISPAEKPEQEIIGLLVYLDRTKPRGQYCRFFDHKCVPIPSTDGRSLWLWGLRFWERPIFLVGFHDPACICPKCSRAKKQPSFE